MKKPFRIDYEKIKRSIYHELYALNDQIEQTRADFEDMKKKYTARFIDPREVDIMQLPDAMRILGQFAKMLDDMQNRRNDYIKIIHELYEQEDADREATEQKDRKNKSQGNKQTNTNEVEGRKVVERLAILNAKNKVSETA